MGQSNSVLDCVWLRVCSTKTQCTTAAANSCGWEFFFAHLCVAPVRAKHCEIVWLVATKWLCACGGLFVNERLAESVCITYLLGPLVFHLAGSTTGGTRGSGNTPLSLHSVTTHTLTLREEKRSCTHQTMHSFTYKMHELAGNIGTRQTCWHKAHNDAKYLLKSSIGCFISEDKSVSVLAGCMYSKHQCSENRNKRPQLWTPACVSYSVNNCVLMRLCMVVHKFGYLFIFFPCGNLIHSQQAMRIRVETSDLHDLHV